MSQLVSHAHVPTMVLMILIISGAMAVAVIYVAWGHSSRDSLRWWGWSMTLNTLAFVAFANVSPAASAWPLVMGNGLMVGAMGLAQRAVTVFVGRPWRVSWLAAPLVVAVLASYLWHDQPALRLPVVDVAVLLQALWLVWLALPPKALRTHWPARIPRGRRLLILGTTLIGALYLQRLTFALMQHFSALDLTTPGLSQTFSYMLGLVGLVLSTLGFILMHKERAEDQLQRMAMQDALTGTANRRGVLAMLERAVAQATRQRTPLSVLMVDIDHFKHVNDTHGHPVGDEVLRQVAQRLQARLRGQDVLGRYGGEEFLVVLPQTDVAGALKLAETLRRRVAESPLHVDGLRIPVTVSLGLHSGVPAPGKGSGAEMVEAADRALYRAKQNGRNQTQCEPSHTAEATVIRS